MASEKEWEQQTAKKCLLQEEEKVEIEAPELDVIKPTKVQSLRNGKEIEVEYDANTGKAIRQSFSGKSEEIVLEKLKAQYIKNKEEGIKILKEIGLNENIRAEKLTLQNFADITNMICSKTI